ncbi:MAG: type II toxin-antitoxin system RelE/ParE family toxin [Candidatus Korobacteraceae bacterium]
MAYKILFTEDALADLEDILDYIRVDSETAAENFGAAILDHVELLREFPHIGTAVSQRPNLRKILHSPVRIYYRIDEGRSLVEILHFWHGAKRDPRI